MDSDEVVRGAIVVNVLVALIPGALLVVALFEVFISASKLLGRLRFKVREVSDSLGFLGACSASALGTAGTGMNWR